MAHQSSASVPFKSIAIMRDLEVRLKNRIAGLTVTSDTDGDGYPISRLSTGANQGLYIRIRTDSDASDDMGKIDGLGLAQRVYAPHVIEVLQEDFAGAVPTTAALDQLSTQTISEITKSGTKVRVTRFEEASLDATDAATAGTAMDAAADSYDIRSDDINPLTSQV